jgi:hypothetical protein
MKIEEQIEILDLNGEYTYIKYDDKLFNELKHKFKNKGIYISDELCINFSFVVRLRHTKEDEIPDC